MRLRVLTESRVEAKRVLSALASALAADGDLLTEGERGCIEAQMAALGAAIEGEDRDAIGAAVEELEALTRPFAERRMDRGIRAALRGRELGDFETADRERKIADTP
jgi:molecular chaperone HscA